MAGSKKNYTIPGHGTQIKHPYVENPSLAKGAQTVDPGCSTIDPKSPDQGVNKKGP